MLSRFKMKFLCVISSRMWISGLLVLSPSFGGSSAGAEQGKVELGPAPLLSEADRIETPAGKQLQAVGLSVDTSSRAQVANFFNNVYTPAFVPPIMWTGDVASCVPGTTNPDYEQATIDVINYFRAMTGLPGNVALDSTLNAKDQQAALMFIAEGNLSHAPPVTWKCWTMDAFTAAGNSNISLGRHGPRAISEGYVTDPGASNTALGHRRWILFPPQIIMGTGSTDAIFPTPQGDYVGSNSLWILGNPPGSFGTRPPTPEWVAWPPGGYVPYQVVFPRWSFSRQLADFSGARVTMTQGATPISLSVLPLSTLQYGDSTIAWEPVGATGGASVPDKKFTVTVSNVMISGTPQDFTYNVTIIDPAIASPERLAWMIY